MYPAKPPQDPSSYRGRLLTSGGIARTGGRQVASLELCLEVAALERSLVETWNGYRIHVAERKSRSVVLNLSRGSLPHAAELQTPPNASEAALQSSVYTRAVSKEWTQVAGSTQRPSKDRPWIEKTLDPFPTGKSWYGNYTGPGNESTDWKERHLEPQSPVDAAAMRHDQEYHNIQREYGWKEDDKAAVFTMRFDVQRPGVHTSLIVSDSSLIWRSHWNIVSGLFSGEYDLDFSSGPEGMRTLFTDVMASSLITAVFTTMIAIDVATLTIAVQVKALQELDKRLTGGDVSRTISKAGGDTSREWQRGISRLSNANLRGANSSLARLQAQTAATGGRVQQQVMQVAQHGASQVGAVLDRVSSTSIAAGIKSVSDRIEKTGQSVGKAVEKAASDLGESLDPRNW